MQCRLLSDLHLEMKDFEVPSTMYDKSSVLILAGDIHPIYNIKNEEKFFDSITGRFKHVVVVAGNHEYYYGVFEDTLKLYRDFLNKYPDISLLENQCRKVSGVAFIGATMWSDFFGGRLGEMMDASRYMSDYSCIRKKDGNRLSPQDTLDVHLKSREYLIETIIEQKMKGNKVVVVTHHCPSFTSQHTAFRKSALNGSFCSDLDDEILAHKPDVWVHGHTHCSCAYRIGDTMIYCNPRGYANFEYNGLFNATFSFKA